MDGLEGVTGPAIEDLIGRGKSMFFCKDGTGPRLWPFLDEGRGEISSWLTSSLRDFSARRCPSFLRFSRFDGVKGECGSRAMIDFREASSLEPFSKAMLPSSCSSVSSSETVILRVVRAIAVVGYLWVVWTELLKTNCLVDWVDYSLEE